MLGIRKYKGVAIDLFQGDITTFACDAMVNAANTELSGGGGVDGAIHQAGGSAIMEECRKIGSCPTGQAVATTAGNLPAQKVIHTVGPIWDVKKHNSSIFLAEAFKNSMILASQLNLPHIAFPAISTGAYQYPVDKAAKVAMTTVKNTLDCNDLNLRRITFVLFDADHYRKFQKQLYITFQA